MCPLFAVLGLPKSAPVSHRFGGALQHILGAVELSEFSGPHGVPPAQWIVPFQDVTIADESFVRRTWTPRPRFEIEVQLAGDLRECFV